MDISQFNFIQFTEEELAEQTQWETIHHQQNELLLSLTEQLTKTNEGETDKLIAQMQETIKEMGTARTELMKIYKAAEERYYESVPTEQAILDDARKVLAVATKEDYENTRKQSYKNYKGISEYIKKDKERYKDVHNAYFNLIALSHTKPPTLNYSGYFAYLIGCTRLQLNAFKHHNLHNAPLADLIREQAAAAYEPPEELPELLTEQQITKLIEAPLNNGELPIDKINLNFVNMINRLYKKEAEGQIAITEFSFGVDTIMESKEERPLVAVSVDFTGLEENITRNISYYDKRVMQAINTLWESGETETTLSRVYTALGGKGRPAASDIEKIKNSIIKQMTILLKLSNELEVEQGYKYGKFEYTGQLLRVEIVTGTKYGKIVDGAIHIFAKPPLIDFAKSRGQITPMPLKMLQAPINKTERNLAIEDYIQYRVCRGRTDAIEAAIQIYSKSKTAKSISIEKKMLYSTIFENADISSRMAQHRAKETIKTIFDYYVEENIKNISACKYDADAVTVKYTFTPEQILQEKSQKKSRKG